MKQLLLIISMLCSINIYAQNEKEVNLTVSGQGKTIDEAYAIKNSAIAEELALPPVKIHCSVLAEDAIKAAVADIKAKQASKQAA